MLLHHSTEWDDEPIPNKYPMPNNNNKTQNNWNPLHSLSSIIVKEYNNRTQRNWTTLPDNDLELSSNTEYEHQQIRHTTYYQTQQNPPKNHDAYRSFWDFEDKNKDEMTIYPTMSSDSMSMKEYISKKKSHGSPSQFWNAVILLMVFCTIITVPLVTMFLLTKYTSHEKQLQKDIAFDEIGSSTSVVVGPTPNADTESKQFDSIVDTTTANNNLLMKGNNTSDFVNMIENKTKTEQHPQLNSSLDSSNNQNNNINIPQQLHFPILINCGGHSLVTKTGNDVIDNQIWLRDEYYSGGDAIETMCPENVGQNEMDSSVRIFSSSIVEYNISSSQSISSSYEIPVPTNQTYYVRLRFVEFLYANERQFDVIIEGMVVAQDFNIFQKTNDICSPVYLETYHGVYVSDSFLTIQFMSKSYSPQSYPIISGIEIYNKSFPSLLDNIITNVDNEKKQHETREGPIRPTTIQEPLEIQVTSDEVILFGTQNPEVIVNNFSPSPVSLWPTIKATPNPISISIVHDTSSSQPTSNEISNVPTILPVSTMPPSVSSTILGQGGDPKLKRKRRIKYRPGYLIREENGLRLSQGLTSKLIAESGKRVKFPGISKRARSKQRFHYKPDAAATFPDTRINNDGGWIYVSNSEIYPSDFDDDGISNGVSYPGGVYALTFNVNGSVINYKTLLDNTIGNCGGGRTPWNTWVSCEEYDYGRIWQVDPLGIRPTQQLTVGEKFPGYFESFAYDARTTTPHFYVSKDEDYGEVTRFTPYFADWSDPWTMLHGPGLSEYLVFDPYPDSEGNNGTYSWSKVLSVGRTSAYLYFSHVEGIDVYDNELYFVAKFAKRLFILNLDDNTYRSQPTRDGLFSGQPDGIINLCVNNTDCISDSDDSNLLYFTEDSDFVPCGIHARKENGEFFTIVESDSHANETTGLAFSPNLMHMYFAFQDDGLLFDITRTDGLPFNARTLNMRGKVS